ncbi:hypothetical protein BO78DRAFT_392658 [Aspergillus sclerotiicarbonarius CBS 121057]|uniref:N-acetyltransferase domain-containing protein n=1 Tax=Aspergillus sclerotiicarbonarius (strain CBS 121057 / IBT 28362) TaxID=1448318 RepID=A0A319FNL8_ASPSB|nr:hypothetical protein BO78DRAFT_392658 [Aspergillus sclerotiicarbonarius CBS 121057]
MSTSSLTTTLTTHPPDHLASSIAQQLQSANKAIIHHPVFLLCLTSALYFTYHLTRTLQPSSWPTTLLITIPACIMTFLLAAAYTTSPYLEKAGRVERSFLRSGNEGDEGGERGDIVVVTKYKGRVIGTLVLRIMHGCSEVSAHLDDRVVRDEGKGDDGDGLSQVPVGVIRAWTVEQRYRGVGIGKGLLEFGVRVCRERGARRVVFSDGHANRDVGLGVWGVWDWDGEREREREREGWARGYLDVIQGGMG